LVPANVRSGAFSGLLAFGIGQLDHVGGWRGWRYIYVIEGGITVVVGVLALFVLQETPEQTKKWLSEDEKRFLVLRAKYLYGGNKIGSKDEFKLTDVAQALKVSHTHCLPRRELTSSLSMSGSWPSLPFAILSPYTVSRSPCLPS